MRTLALGILPEYRRRGFDALLYFEAMKEGVRLKYREAEFSWLLEDNLDIQRPLEVFGGRIYRRYRIVERLSAERVGNSGGDRRKTSQFTDVGRLSLRRRAVFL